MKSIFAVSFVVLLFLSASFANFKEIADEGATSEFTSVRNLPVILKNEVLSNDRCRLHLDTGATVDVSCKHTADAFEG